ncbi:unnamed protein product [Penicillium glandicola]
MSRSALGLRARKRTSTTSSNDSNDSSGGSSLSTGAIVGIAIDTVAAVALIALAVFFFLRRRKEDDGNEPEQSILPLSASQSASELASKHADENVFAIPLIENGELSSNDTQIYQLDADPAMDAIRGRPAVYELPGMGIPQPAELSERDTESPAASAMSLVSPGVSFPFPSPDVSRTSTQRL